VHIAWPVKLDNNGSIGAMAVTLTTTTTKQNLDPRCTYVPTRIKSSFQKRLLKLTDLKTFFGYFHVLQVETVLEGILRKNETFQKSRKIPFLSILAKFYKVKKITF
jgi:hypothetical protein